MNELENMNEKREGRRKMNKIKILLPVTTRHIEACAYKYQTYDVCSYASCNLHILLR